MTNQINNSKNAIVTVVGSDHVGIIAKVSSFFAEHNINIEDISQTIMSGNLVMMMAVDLSKSNESLENLKNKIKELGKSAKVMISILHEDVFTAMHRI